MDNYKSNHPPALVSKKGFHTLISRYIVIIPSHPFLYLIAVGRFRNIRFQPAVLSKKSEHGTTRRLLGSKSLLAPYHQEAHHRLVQPIILFCDKPPPAHLMLAQIAQEPLLLQILHTNILLSRSSLNKKKLLASARRSILLFWFFINLIH